MNNDNENNQVDELFKKLHDDNNPYPKGEVDKSGIEFNSDADTTINSAALANQDISSDEMTLMDTIGQNPFTLFFIRTFIKVKNHVSIIPMILTVISMMILTIPIQIHVNCMVTLKNDTYNAFYFFVDVILSIISILCYLNVNSKKSSKNKRIAFSILFYVLMTVQAFFAFYFLRDIKIETNLYSSSNKVVDTNERYLAKSQSFFIIHLISTLLTIIFAILAPIVQPFCKKISINSKKKKDVTDETNVENDSHVTTLETSNDEILVETDEKNSDSDIVK